MMIKEATNSLMFMTDCASQLTEVDGPTEYRVFVCKYYIQSVGRSTST